jgi:hypothetical protein
MLDIILSKLNLQHSNAMKWLHNENNSTLLAIKLMIRICDITAIERYSFTNTNNKKKFSYFIVLKQIIF